MLQIIEMELNNAGISTTGMNVNMAKRTLRALNTASEFGWDAMLKQTCLGSTVLDIIKKLM